MIIIKINSVDISNKIQWSDFYVKHNLNDQVDTANFTVLNIIAKTLTIGFNDDVEILDGSEKIFSGKVINTTEQSDSGGADLRLSVECVDNSYDADKLLFSGTFLNKTIKEIIDSVVAAKCVGFTTNNVTSSFLIEKIVFNQLPVSKIIQRLADIVQYNWYWDADKDLHFFDKETNTAPFDITDNNGNYIYKTLNKKNDGSQIVTVVKVRGGEYPGNVYTDVITVKGDDSKSFKLPYKLTDLTIRLDTGSGYVSKTVGKDFEDDFDLFDVLHNFADQSFRFENPLTDGDKIEFAGRPQVRVFVGVEDPINKAEFGAIEKIIRDDSIRSNEVARKRAAAELYAFSNEIIDAKFETLTPGLRSGMIINLSSVKKNYNDKLLIKSITFKPSGPNQFKYSVECISTKRYDLIDLLRKIIEPETLDIDESEASENLYIDTQNLSITEEISNINPVEADESIGSITESILLDPIDPDDLEFVLLPYTPTGQTDTKRPGRLDISMTVY